MEINRVFAKRKRFFNGFSCCLALRQLETYTLSREEFNSVVGSAPHNTALKYKPPDLTDKPGNWVYKQVMIID